MQYKKLPNTYFKKILEVCEEERVYKRGEREEMYENKLLDIEAIANEYMDDFKNMCLEAFPELPNN